MAEKSCLTCRRYPNCMELQLDYKKRREFNELDSIFHNPDRFFEWMAESCKLYEENRDVLKRIETEKELEKTQAITTPN